MDFWRDFPGPNAAYMLDLYERYKKDPSAVDKDTRAFFDQNPLDGQTAAPVSGIALDQIVGAANLARSIREFGYLDAQLDPLGNPSPGDPSLRLEAHDLTEEGLRSLPASLIGGPIVSSAATALDAIQTLRQIYSGTLGHDHGQVRVPQEREWLRDAAESRRFSLQANPVDPRTLLERLTQVEVFEQFLHRIFPGKHRFSIEGLDSMVPMLDEIICGAAESGIRNVLIGMAHRGRLNFLAHVLQKPYAQILAEFKDPVQGRHFRDDLGWTGDVKYHAGAYRAADNPNHTGCDVAVTMAPNPSHLEAVNPVVKGMARAVGTFVDSPGAPTFDPAITLPLLVHGDAAFPGQGIVAETLNMFGLQGYTTGGTIHIIANNQLGYTTNPQDSRSTLYASDLAKGFKIPILHVNADDPEACIEAARMAFAYREQFHKDFMIDVIGYRRHGHNEGDEPSFTQPLMYDTIRRHATVRALYAETLVQRGAVEADLPDTLARQHMDRLQQTLESLNPEEDLREPQPDLAPPGTARKTKTAISLKRLQKLNESLLEFPTGFNLHPKLQQARRRRLENLKDPDNRAVDWATAEELALASILEDGIPIRFTGEDAERGTFNQRHAVFHDVQSGALCVPLQSIPQGKASFEIQDSPLSEAAALGFEYGYNIQAPERLVLWEAQYGDFINGAQVIVDEFITTARAKWGQNPSLVLLLPHGHEGAGPDHSSGRLERFLQLTGENNMRIANCTTAAQYFHLLRRQAILLKTDPLPLIVMTPKSLLRHPLVASTLREVAEGQWLPVIDDAREPGEIRRLFLCSGKIYIDLISSDYRDQHPEVAIVRIEQLYPFPEADLKTALDRCPNLEEVIWVQEEPENMGAWWFMQSRLGRIIAGRWPLRYVGRTTSSSPAEGSSAWFAANQAQLIQQAFDPGPDHIQDDFIIS